MGAPPGRDTSPGLGADPERGWDAIVIGEYERVMRPI
jgi:hypothetical protein